MVDGSLHENAIRPVMVYRWMAVCVGLALVGGYLFAPDLPLNFGGVNALVDRVQHEFSQVTFSFFANSYTRMAVYLLPALGFLTWGVAGLFNPIRLERALQSISARPWPWVVLLAAAAGSGTWLLGEYVLERQPVMLGDEYSYVFQAKLFASGRLYTETAADHIEFDNRAIMTGNGPRRYGMGFPGHALFLVPGIWVGDMWLVPAVLAGLSVLLVFIIGRMLLGAGVGLLAALFLASSPYFLFYHATLLPQSSTIFCELVLLCCALRCARGGGMAWGVMAALTMALLVFVRAQSAMLMGTPLMLCLLLQGDSPLRRRATIVLLLGGGVVVGAAALMLNASWTSGAPLMLRLAPRPAGFTSGYSSGLGVGNPLRGVANTAITLARVNMCLLGWPLSFLPLLMWSFMRGKTRWEIVLGVCALAFPVFYFFYFGRQEHYYLDIVPLVMLLGAAGLLRWGQRVGAASAAGLVVAGFSLATVGVWPFRCTYFARRVANNAAIVRTIESAELSHAIVLLEGMIPDHMSIIGQNSPELDDDVIFAERLPNGADCSTLALFPGREAYVVKRDPDTNAYKCVAWVEDCTAPPETAAKPDEGN